MRIALDAMGGDYAPKNTIEGAVLALKEYPFLEKLFLVGDAVVIGSELKRLDCKDSRIEIFHASEVVSMKESAAKAVRHKKDASICRAVDLVKNGSAHAVVSAGHTGAAVAAAVLKLRTLKGIERPAIVCLLPTESKVFVLIDGGANPDSTPENLVQFAIMGSVFSQHVLGYKTPSVALMSIGEEDIKGNDVTKEAFKLLKASGLNFRGNIEGHDLFENPAKWLFATASSGTWFLRPLRQSLTRYSPGSSTSFSKIQSAGSAPSSPKERSSRSGKRQTMRNTAACRCSASTASALSLMERVRR